MMAYAHSLSQTGLYVAAGWSTENSLSSEGEETKESVEQYLYGVGCLIPVFCL